MQLAEPVRFRDRWEQVASLRLRTGEATVPAAYDQHARIRGGEPEQMMDAAAADYLALLLDGTDVLLMAADHVLRRELSRRIRDDLIRLGVVSAGPAVRIADGTAASAGDLIICTANDHAMEAGEPGRTLANGDLLRIEQVASAGLIVRRALDADPATGHRRWTDRTFLYRDFAEAELGYAVTDHTAQSRTVTAGLAVITGAEDRQHAYGTDSGRMIACHPGAWLWMADTQQSALQDRYRSGKAVRVGKGGQVSDRLHGCSGGLVAQAQHHDARVTTGRVGANVAKPAV